MIIITAAGRLGQDAVLRDAGNSRVCNFSVACDYTHRGEKKTQWVDCSLWGRRGESLAPYLTKGSAITFTGRVWVEMIDTQHGPQPKLKCEVYDIALQSRPANPTSSAPAPERRERPAPAPANAATASEFDDDILF